MYWNFPYVLILLPLVPVAFLLARAYAKRQIKRVHETFSHEITTRLFQTRSQYCARLKGACLLLGVCAVILALAEPHFGATENETQSYGRDVFVLFDVSDSMLAEDMPPNRLAIAKLDVEDLLDVMRGDRVGLIAFAGSAQVEVPLTTDYNFFRDILRNVDTSTVCMGGTAIGDAIRLALARFGQEETRQRAIILITDGEDHDSMPTAAAESAAQLNVPIYAIALGSSQGAKIPVFDVAGNKTGYKVYDGHEALSMPDVETLKQIAKITNGRFYNATANLDLARVYATSVETLERSQIASASHIVLKNQYQICLALAIVAFALYYFLPVRFSKGINDNTLNKVHYVSTRSILLLTLIISLSAPYRPSLVCAAQGSDAQATPVKRVLSKKEEIQRLNDANALLAQGNVEEATVALEELSEAKTPSVAARAQYNLAYLALLQSQNKLETLREQKEEEEPSQQTQSSVEGQEQAPLGSNPENLVNDYNVQRSKRDASRRDAYQDAQRALALYNDAAKYRAYTKDARQNISDVFAWIQKEQVNENARELDLRAQALSDPQTRLTWLQQETSNLIDDVLTARNQPFKTSLLKRMPEEAKSIQDWSVDFNAIAENLLAQVAQSATIPPVPGLNLNQESNSPDQTELTYLTDTFTRAQSQFQDAVQSASTSFVQFDDTGVFSLLNAQNQLLTLREATAPYDALVIQAAQQEKELLDQTLNSESFLEADQTQIIKYHWNRRAFKEFVAIMTHKAQTIQDTTPEDPENSTHAEDNLESFEEQTPTQEDDPDAIEFDPDYNELSGNNGVPSPQEKVRASAKLALQYSEELNALTDELIELTHEYQPSAKIAQEGANRQARINQIMQEIIEPLLDDQQNQNQNSDSNSRQNQSDNSQQDQDNSQDSPNDSPQSRENQDQQSDSNKQDDQSQDDSDASESNPDDVPENLEEPPKEQGEEQEDDKPEQEQANQRDTVDATTREKKQAQDKEDKTDAQREADALVRQVQRRQKDAEPTRRSVRQALKKREKSGKDW
ncbi:MAG: VWA domain-containing protein [Planctomycetia bacterium]|nr:VWA domain-containing protein [Planctomycetia bacterium]